MAGNVVDSSQNWSGGISFLMKAKSARNLKLLLDSWRHEGH